MKKIIIELFVISNFISLPLLAGGVHCKQCPSESMNCLPMAGCQEYLDEQNQAIEYGRCPSNSVLECKGKFIESTCEIESQEGTCLLTPATAGSFCMCSRK